METTPFFNADDLGLIRTNKDCSFDISNEDNVDAQYIVPHEVNDYEDVYNSENVKLHNENVWKGVRSSPVRCFTLCLQYCFSIIILSGILVGIIGVILALIYATFGELCATSNHLPTFARQIQLIASSTAGWFIEFSHVFVMYLIFGSRVIIQLHIFEWNLSVAFLDTIYRLYWYVYVGEDYGELQAIPIQMMMMCVISFNSFRIAKQHSTNFRQQFIFVLQLGLQFLLSIIVMAFMLHVIIPIFIKSSPERQVIIVALFSFTGLFIKHYSKKAAQHMKYGHSYGVLITTYMGLTILTRTLHAGIKTPYLFVLTCIIHSLLGSFERLSLIFAGYSKGDHYMKKCQRKLTADVIICNLMQETSTSMVTIITIQFMKYKYSVLAKQDDSTFLYVIIPRLIFSVVVEFMFSMCVMFFLTWYHNVPIMRRWDMKRKNLLLANFGMVCFAVLFVTDDIVKLVVKSYQADNLVLPSCDITEIFFFVK